VRYQQRADELAVTRDPWLLDPMDRDSLAVALAAARDNNPVGILPITDDGGQTLVGVRGAPLTTTDVLGLCLAKGRQCIVLACPLAETECLDRTRQAWQAATAAEPAMVHRLLLELYSALATSPAPPIAIRLDATPGEAALRQVVVRVR
jgi:hypothetical protein